MDNQQENSNIHLYYLKSFLKYRKFILINSGIALLLSIVMAFFIMDHIFKSTATVKVTSKGSGLAGLLGQSIPDIGDFGDLAGGLTGGSAKELALYENILNSRRCVEETIIKFNLLEEYNHTLIDNAVKDFRDNIMVINKDRVSGTMEIGVYDKDPAKAQEMVQFLIDQLNKINIEMNVQDAKNNREFIEQRLNLVKIDLSHAEDSLKYFQDIFGVVPDLTIKAIIKSEMELEVQIKSEEIKLDLLKEILSPNEAEVKNQEAKINALQKQLNNIKSTSYIDSKLGLKGAPDVAMEFFRLSRNLEIQNRILSFIVPLYEQAKIEENKHTPSVLMLDYPSLPDKKAKPKRLPIVIVATFIAFIGSFVFFIFRDKFGAISKSLNEV